MSQKHKAVVASAAFDSGDGHLRITEGKEFKIIGGDSAHHESMAEKFSKMEEKLRKKGRDLSSCDSKEFEDLAGEQGIKLRRGCDCNHREN